MIDQSPAERFPTLLFLARYHSIIVWLVTLLVLVGGVWYAFAAQSLAGAIVAVLAGALSYFVLRAVFELLELITELLIPQ